MVLQEIDAERRVAPGIPDATRIPALPPHLQEVPTDPEDWKRWREEMREFRTRIRERAASDPDLQRALFRASADDPAFFLCVFGSIYEPRWVEDKPPGWRPWLLFAFQVEMIRVAQMCLKTRSGPERHLLNEKSRDVGASWIFCGLAAHAWLFAFSVTIGMVSREASLVDERGDFNSMFFKVRGVLGIEESTPEDMRLPDYIFPAGFKDEHDKIMQLTHPSKPNQIKGETTTRNTGRGKRYSWRINDEAAFNRHYRSSKAGQFNSTDHIFSISSAGLDDGGFFRDECEEARENANNPHVRTQTLVTIPWYVHPLHDEQWYRETKAEMDKTDPYAFDREVLMRYTAGQGSRVYPDLQYVEPIPAPYVPGAGPVLCGIDPGLSDPTALLWMQYIVADRRWRVVRAQQVPNGSAKFIASILTAVVPDDITSEQYERYLQVRDLMLWVRGVTDPISYLGDPYGANRGGDGEMTFYERLAEQSAKLTGGRHVIVVMYGYEPEKKEFRHRIRTVREMLPRVDWHHDPDVVQALNLIKEAKFPDVTSRAVQAPDKPIHDRTSHYRQALEFIVVNQDIDAGLSDVGDRDVSFVNLGGEIPVFAQGMAELERDAPYRDDTAIFKE